MTYPLAEAAEALGSDRLQLTVHNAWAVATPAASIHHAPTIIDIERAPLRVHVHIDDRPAVEPGSIDEMAALVAVDLPRTREAWRRHIEDRRGEG